MRVLVTGASGFVGRHLSEALTSRGHEIIAADHRALDDALLVDMRDSLAVRGMVELAQPDAIAHLAAQASPRVSLDDPEATFDVNATGTLRLLEAVRAIAPRRSRLLVISSADVYGVQPPQNYPLQESSPPMPRNPYAASKAAAEALAIAYARSYGVDVVVTRAFNHIGPGQDERFAVPAFAGQIARVAAGREQVVRVGNLDASRDFLDVRDVCDAYVALLEGAGTAGEIYNICSGKAMTMREVLRRLIEIAHVAVEVREDPGRLRPADVPLSVGDAGKLRAATGWAPRIPPAAALRGVYDDAVARTLRQGFENAAQGETL